MSRLTAWGMLTVVGFCAAMGYGLSYARIAMAQEGNNCDSECRNYYLYYVADLGTYYYAGDGQRFSVALRANRTALGGTLSLGGGEILVKKMSTGSYYCVNDPNVSQDCSSVATVITQAMRDRGKCVHH